MRELDVPEIVRTKARLVGAEGWLAALPTIVAALEDDWSMTVGAPFADVTEAFVAEATLDDGTRAVLKVVVPRAHDVVRNEITVLRLADGDGCAALLRDDEVHGAMLLERLGPSLHHLDLPLEARLAILTDTASRVWRPAPDCGLPTGADKGAWLVQYIADTWETLDRPCSERAVEHALTCAARRIAAHDDERAVLVHGDVHQWNVCQAGDGYKLIDPDGLLAEAEYDLGVLLREDPVELLETTDPRERSHALARRTGLSAEAIWEWGAIERVSTGLLLTHVDLQPLGRQMLATADAVAE